MHTLSLDELRQRLVYEGFRVMVATSNDTAGVAGTRIDAQQLMHQLPRHLLACLLTRQPDMAAVDAMLEQGAKNGPDSPWSPLGACRHPHASTTTPTTELSAYLSDMEYTDTYRDHITQGLQLVSHLLTIAPSVAGFGEALQQVGRHWRCAIR